MSFTTHFKTSLEKNKDPAIKNYFTIYHRKNWKSCPRLRIEVRPTVLLRYNAHTGLWPWLKILANYGHDTNIKTQSSKVSRFKR